VVQRSRERGAGYGIGVGASGGRPGSRLIDEPANAFAPKRLRRRSPPARTGGADGYLRDGGCFTTRTATCPRTSRRFRERRLAGARVRGGRQPATDLALNDPAAPARAFQRARERGAGRAAEAAPAPIRGQGRLRDLGTVRRPPAFPPKAYPAGGGRLRPAGAQARLQPPGPTTAAVLVHARSRLPRQRGCPTPTTSTVLLDSRPTVSVQGQ
jgi:hypothetical protein